MLCPECGEKTKVIDTGLPKTRCFRIAEAWLAEEVFNDSGIMSCVIRVRSCPACEHRFSTIEASTEDVRKMLE